MPDLDLSESVCKSDESATLSALERARTPTNIVKPQSAKKPRPKKEKSKVDSKCGQDQKVVHASGSFDKAQFAQRESKTAEPDQTAGSGEIVSVGDSF